MKKLILLCILLSSCASKLEDDLPLNLVADSSAFIVLDFNKANYNGYAFTKNKKKYLIIDSNRNKAQNKGLFWYWEKFILLLKRISSIY